MEDPDNRAMAEAAAVLKRMLGDRRHVVTAKEAEQIAFAIVSRWIQSRTCHWATRRGTPRIGTPDAMTRGFTEASLSLIADKAGPLPFHLPIGQWSKADAIALFATAWEAVEHTRIQTLEDPTEWTFAS